MLENVRYEPGETESDPKLSAALAALRRRLRRGRRVRAARAPARACLHRGGGAAGEEVHRAAGLLLEREVTTLLELIEASDRPLVAILGGAKVSDKIRVIERFLQGGRCGS